MKTALTFDQARRWIRTGARGVRTLIYPPQCYGCHAVVPEDTPICAICLKNLEPADPAQMRSQLAAFPEKIPELEAVFALWTFDKGGTVQTLQHALKYENRPTIGHDLGRWMAEAFAEIHPWPDVVIPIPLHPKRYVQRGYNQSAWLAQGFANYAQLPTAEEALQRGRATQSQTNLNQTERWQNVQGAFVLTDPKSLQNKNILLIDDVFTTGATLLAALQTLREVQPQTLGMATLAFARS